MTNQELFDIALNALRKQRVASIVPDSNSCRYRGQNGTRCAIGHAIPDDEYDPDMEGMDAGEIHDHPDFGQLLEGVDYKFAIALQLAHDYYLPLPHDIPETYGAVRRKRSGMKEGRGMELWEEAMKEIAAKFNLNYTEPTA